MQRSLRTFEIFASAKVLAIKVIFSTIGLIIALYTFFGLFVFEHLTTFLATYKQEYFLNGHSLFVFISIFFFFFDKFLLAELGPTF